MFGRLIISAFLLFTLVSFDSIWAQDTTIKEILTNSYNYDDVKEYFGEQISTLEKGYYDPGEEVDLDIGKLKVQRILGEGMEGAVYEVSNADGSVVALKLPYAEHQFAISYLRDRKLLGILDHPNVISIEDSTSKFITMKVANGSLADLIKLADSVHAEGAIEMILQRAIGDVIDGMMYLYTNGINFTDLNSSNVACFWDDNRIKQDVGWATCFCCPPEGWWAKKTLCPPYKRTRFLLASFTNVVWE